jgi:exodeoxyribonuclease V alpha subunit
MRHARQTIRGKMNPHMNAAIPERGPVTEEISRLIERVTFHNDESGFCALRVKAHGQREETTVVGSLPSVTAGEWSVAEGWWMKDKEHGLEFKATIMKTMPPTPVEGIERYLSSGLVKGIGPILAKKLVGRFGVEVLGVIEKRAAELQSVDGIGPKAPGADRARMARGNASPRNHAVLAQPRRERQPGGANLQDP